MSFRENETVFFTHPEHSWVVGTVTKADGGKFTCKAIDPVRKEVKQGDIVEKLTEDRLANLQSDCLDERVHDLLNLQILHDSTLLRCLYIRYMDDVIYTNIGAIVVALNPFNFHIPRYQEDKMQSYLNEGHEIKLNIPHSWAQAHNTYYEMIDNREDQCVLISGESGAGKTEATKIVMKYLGAVSCLQGTNEEKAAGGMVGTKLASCSPILEAFGNAKTVRNDNSSRFGKFMKVKFDPNGRLTGAHTTKYLLEKSRIVTAARDERVYHSFYIVVRGKYKKFLGLEYPEQSFQSLIAGKCLNNKEFDTAEDFAEVCNAMHGVGMSEHEIKSIWLIPAGVLCLQNVTFSPKDDGCTVEEKNMGFLKHVCKLWEIDFEALKMELLTTTISLPGGKTVTKQNTTTSACDCRDALCKGSYDGAFAWLVEKCNEKCDVPSTGNWVGLLDIFGFEDFEKNSFEQLCINLTNETLQNHYNSYIFTRDMEECRAEGIDVTEIKCPDNEPCLKLIGARGGVIALLDDECSRGEAGTDAGFYNNVCSAHAMNPFFVKPKIARDTFNIKHYAAEVTYNTVGWLDKNRDTLKDAVKSLVRASANDIVSIVLPEPLSPDQKKGRQLTVGGFFRDQVQELMNVINSTNPHWIRCVKPHPAKKPKMLHGVQTMNQLESSGVLGTVKIRKAGYPVRTPNERFVHRYQMCAKGVNGDQSAIISAILTNAKINDKSFAQMGKSKVFLKSQAHTTLERYRDDCLIDYALNFQRLANGFMPRKQLFSAYVEKHRARLLKEKREREERERQEREAEERRLREEAERERKEREAEERRLAEERKRTEEQRRGLATCLQRHIRGGLTRLQLFRRILETLRCEFESKREAQIISERTDAKEVDAMRLKAEKHWVAYLNEVDELERYQHTEKERERKKSFQKERIQKRELERQERIAREEILAEENNERWMFLAKADSSKKAKLREIERKQKRQNEMNMSAANPTTAQPKKRPVEQRHTDPRSSVLSQYAVHRARLFDEFFQGNSPAPPPPSRAFQATREPTATPSQNKSVKKQLFERSKNRWEREEEWLESRTNLGAAPQDETSHLDSMFNGPYQMAPSSSASPPPGSYSAPPWMHESPTVSQRKLESDLASRVDWGSVNRSL